MRFLLPLAAVLVLCAGCYQHIVNIRLFDRKGKPVMVAAIAVEGKRIKGYEDSAKTRPKLKDFFAMDAFTEGEFTFGVWGEPYLMRVSADAPGFYKCVAGFQLQKRRGGQVKYILREANSPYDTSHFKTSKRGYHIYIDIFLEQSGKRRAGTGGWRPGGTWEP